MTATRPAPLARPANPIPWIAFALVYLAALASVAVSVDGLPERVASNFGAGGRAQAFMSRAEYRWVFLGYSFAVPLILVAALSWLPRHFPRFAGIPNREAWLAPEHRAALLARMDRAAVFLASAAALFFAAMHALILDANASRPPQLANRPFLAVLLAFLVATVGTSLWLQLSLRRPPR